LPSEFRSDSEKPVPAAANGTIYGQVFPVQPAGLQGAFVEIHYYHLWRKDCGSFGHQLDAEYVSALIHSEGPANSPESWKAVYWYAGAHEGTLCDASNAGRASAVQAEDRGPEVWISRGKHASFLSLELCRKIGCGGDQCDEMTPVPRGRIVNVGEPSAPMNGSGWIDDRSWPLPHKLESDFDDTSLAKFAELDPSEAGFLNDSLPPMKAFLLGGNFAIESLFITDAQARSALSTAGKHAGGATKTGLGATLRSIWHSLRATTHSKSDDR
jgi:hypothetical protein